MSGPAPVTPTLVSRFGRTRRHRRPHRADRLGRGGRHGARPRQHRPLDHFAARAVLQRLGLALAARSRGRRRWWCGAGSWRASGWFARLARRQGRRGRRGGRSARRVRESRASPMALLLPSDPHGYTVERAGGARGQRPARRLPIALLLAASWFGGARPGWPGSRPDGDRDVWDRGSGQRPGPLVPARASRNSWPSSRSRAGVDLVGRGRRLAARLAGGLRPGRRWPRSRRRAGSRPSALALVAGRGVVGASARSSSSFGPTIGAQLTGRQGRDDPRRRGRSHLPRSSTGRTSWQGRAW
jgi:hypothetical protein